MSLRRFTNTKNVAQVIEHLKRTPNSRPKSPSTEIVSLVALPIAPPKTIAKPINARFGGHGRPAHLGHATLKQPVDAAS
jgi:hypothetical protein